MNLYVHIPFCERVCIYCDFYVTTARKYFGPFQEALAREMDMYATDLGSQEIETVYFGGGTPSFLPLKSLESTIGCLRRAFVPDKTREITLEANPNNVSADNLAAWRSMGINRLSIGVQSFSDEELKFLTRNHTAQMASSSVRMAREAGFENMTMDLIFGVPGQTPSSWRDHLRHAVELGCPHISVYNLTVEEGTYLHKMQTRRRLPERDEETELRMYLDAIDILGHAGYEHYEISNYARPGFRSLHNTAYWTGRPYLGLGPSAHSYDGQSRWWNVSDVREYVSTLQVAGRLPVEDRETIDMARRCVEIIFLGLRRCEGFSISELEELGGWNFDEKFRQSLEKTTTYWIRENNRLRLTAEGSFLCNRISAEFIAAI